MRVRYSPTFTCRAISAFLLGLALLGASDTAYAQTDNATRFRKHEQAVPNQYIVVLHDEISRQEVKAMIREVTGRGARVGFTYRNALNGFSVRMSESQAEQLSADSRVQYVQEDGRMGTLGYQSNPPWQIDRLDQEADEPLDQSFSFEYTGAGVNIYVLDTGIYTTHSDFGGRAKLVYDPFVSPVYNAGTGLGKDSTDCNGHGTFVAGLAGSTTYGIAKQANLKAVRVLDCSGSGTSSSVIAGMDWVTANKVLPAVANISLGGPKDSAVDAATDRMVAAGVIVVVAAGNSGKDAKNYSPASKSNVLVVGSMDSTNTRTSWSNYGSVVNIYAPGTNVYSTYIGNTTAQAVGSGTSFSAPLVAGMVAAYLHMDPYKLWFDAKSDIAAGYSEIWGTVNAPTSTTSSTDQTTSLGGSGSGGFKNFGTVTP